MRKTYPIGRSMASIEDAAADEAQHGANGGRDGRLSAARVIERLTHQFEQMAQAEAAMLSLSQYCLTKDGEKDDTAPLAGPGNQP